MICRVWRGWTTPANADAYRSYLNDELFPRVEKELTKYGYRGFQVLTLSRGTEVEFVTMLWFDLIEGVKSFAGQDYGTPVISEKAKALLSRHAEHCDHYDVSGSSWPFASN